ncbi:MAG: DNA gyrase inhibitor YacG [Pirellulales bacterium]|nr:DNA gyrase inhibitor YacG [Pirellulales bacterium]
MTTPGVVQAWRADKTFVFAYGGPVAVLKRQLVSHDVATTMSILLCSICRRPFDPEQSRFMPFCSERCRRIDLNRWLDEAYGLPYDAPESPETLDGNREVE